MDETYTQDIDFDLLGDDASVVDIPPAVNKLQEILQTQNVVEVLDSDVWLKLGYDLADKYSEYESNLSKKHKILKEIKEYYDDIIATEPKNTPFEGAANIKMPLLQEAILQFHSDFSDSILILDEFVKGDVSEKLDTTTYGQMYGQQAEQMQQEVKQRQALYKEMADRLAKFLNYQLKELMPEFEDDLNSIGIYLPLLGTVLKQCGYDPIERKSKHILIKPYDFVFNKGAKNERDAQFIGIKIEFTRKQIDDFVRGGQFKEYRNFEGLDEQDIDYDEVFEFYEIDCLLDLDGDGVLEPYCAYVDVKEKVVPYLYKRFDESRIVHDDYGQILRINPEHRYVRYIFFPSAENEFYGTGLGELMFYPNKTLNTVINQVLDAGTRQNMGGGYVASDANVKSGRLPVGLFERADVPSGDLSKAFFNLPVVPPNMTMVELARFVAESVKGLGALNTVNADNMPANMPATSTMAIVEQGVKRYKAIFLQFLKSFKREIDILINNNKKYLSVNEYIYVVRNAISNEFLNVGQDIDIAVNVNMSAVNRFQKMAQMQVLESFKGDPLVDQQRLRREIIEAAGFEDADTYIIVPPPDPAQTAQIQATIAQIQANANVLNAQADKLRADIPKDKLKGISDAMKSGSEHLVKTTQAIKNLADAESKEAGQQNEQYYQQTNQIRKDLNG